MMHKPIQLKNLSLSFVHKTCFDNFSTEIHYGSRIAIIGKNGSGKSTLLKMLQGIFVVGNGEILIPKNVIFGYVPQVIEEPPTLSGGQRLNKVLTKTLSHNPNVLLLDEPTNHLDSHNRKSLLRCLLGFSGTLIIVSHDTEVLRHCTDTLWHLDKNKINVFKGHYDDYKHELQIKHASLEQALTNLDRKKKAMHQALMQEQQRAARSKAKGEKSINKRKWPTIVSHAKAGRGEETSGRKKAVIQQKKQDLINQLANINFAEIITPKFHLSSVDTSDHTVVSISEGEIGYAEKPPLICNINLSLNFASRMAIIGKNASGKSTLVKAILQDSAIIKSGDWHAPKRQDIGYLDQHYATLFTEKTVIESIMDIVPTWTYIEARRHLNDFLFRKNEEINMLVKQLSGGEKARLSLAQIAAKTPRLLILDEITNNLDLETREHMINVLVNYPGAMIVVSHDSEFLKKIAIEQYYNIIDNHLSL